MEPERGHPWISEVPPSYAITALWVGIYMAGRGLTANKLRSLLTMLGVIIGVGAVIVAIAIGAGSREAVARSIQRLGTNVLTVRPGQQRMGGINLGPGSMTTLKLEDADAILKDCPSIERVCPQVSGNGQIKARDQNVSASINGVSPDYGEIQNHHIAIGRLFSEGEYRSYKRVAVLGSTLATDLFKNESALNQQIRISGQAFYVVGVLEQKGGQGFRNPDESVYIPTTTAMRRLFGLQNVQNITCQAASLALMAEGENEIEKVLRKRHQLASSDANDFMIFNQADLMEAQNAQQGTFSALITWLAVVSLAVGGIGIMNIMFVSVTERTREIGVRKAIGARRQDVLMQFLFEALFISAAGGVLGVLVGVFGAGLVGRANNWTVAILPGTVLLAFSFSVLVGVFFGFYPAFKASNLRPIEALRYE